MHNSKRIRRMIIAIALIIVILLGLDYILYPCTFMRNDIHTVTTQKHQDIFMGTSHGKMNIDPKTISSVTGRTGHNLCVGGEYGIDAYYLAKLLLEKQKPERIIYEVDPGYFATQKEEGNNYLLFYHQFPISVSKAEYFGDLLLDCDFRSVLFPWYEYSLSYEIQSIPKTVSKKWNRDYSVSDLKSDSQEYHTDGFIERYAVDTSTLKMIQPKLFSEDTVNVQSMEYLQKLIKLCRKERIEFVAVTTPIPEETLKKYQESYEEAWNYFETFFGKEKVQYLNFNTTYYELFSHDINSYTDYDGHMNGDSARNYSEILAYFLKK